MASVGMIYIGSFAQADTDESDWDNENDYVFAGTHGKSVLKHITATVTTPLGDGVVYDDDSGQTPSQITYNLGAGPATVTQDSVAAYNVSILLGNGSTLNTVVNVIQLTNGVTFINESVNGIQLDGLSIQSVTIGTVFEENASGWLSSRSINGASIVCFAGGSLIATPNGARLVETLVPGDLVLTLDHGAQPLVFCASQSAPGQGAVAPVMLQPDALGPGLPRTPLQVSPQHRILLRPDWGLAEPGQAEVFVAAKHLVGLPGISQPPDAGQITYHHLMLPRHEVIFANGIACESFFPGPFALGALSRVSWDRLKTYFRSQPRGPQAYRLCRPVLKGRALRQILARHRETGSPLAVAQAVDIRAVAARLTLQAAG